MEMNVHPHAGLWLNVKKATTGSWSQTKKLLILKSTHHAMQNRVMNLTMLSHMHAVIS